MAPPIAHIVLALVLYVFITTAQIRQVKPGQCPPKSWCPPQVQTNECQKDDDCSKQEKCCNVCGNRCLDPTKVTTLKVKLGSCPMELDFLLCDTEEPRSECVTDGNCRGGLKCCQSGCGTRCVLALQDKRGSCPSHNTSACALQAPPSPDECHQDMQCPGSERCCCNDCVRKCTATVTVKPGQCPPKSSCSPRDQTYLCQKDGDCAGRRKCCNVCGKRCRISTKERDGFCPVSSSCVAPPDSSLCTRDIDCPPRLKCCLSMNRMECMEPMAEYV